MHFVDWLLVALPLLVILGVGFRARSYIKSVSGFLSAGRCAGRYLLSVADGSAGLGLITMVGMFEMYYRTGNSIGFWSGIGILVGLGNKLGLTEQTSSLKPSHMSGPLGMGMVLFTSVRHSSFVSAVYFMVIISFALAIFNLFPLPVLDGGHITFGLIEIIFRRPLPTVVIKGLSTVFVVLLIGILFGCLSTFVFAGAADPDPAPRPGTSFLTLVSETWHNREYRLLTGFFSYQSLFAWLSTGFIFVYLQAEDGMNFSMMTIQIMLAVSALVAFLSGYFFRVVGSKYGRKPVLVLCSVLKGVEFILWGILLPLNGILDEIGIWISA